MLEWIFARCNNTAGAVETPFGNAPDRNDLDLNGLNISSSDLDVLLRADEKALLDEIPDMRNHLAQFGDKLPRELSAELDRLEKRLKDS